MMIGDISSHICVLFELFWDTSCKGPSWFWVSYLIPACLRYWHLEIREDLRGGKWNRPFVQDLALSLAVVSFSSGSSSQGSQWKLCRIAAFSRSNCVLLHHKFLHRFRYILCPSPLQLPSCRSGDFLVLEKEIFIFVVVSWFRGLL